MIFLFFFFFLNVDINNNVKIIKSLEDFGVLSDGGTETVKHATKKQKRSFLGAL